MMGSWWRKGAWLQGSHTRANEVKSDASKAGIRRAYVENSITEFSEGENLMAEKRKDRHRPGYIEKFNTETYDNIRIRVRKDSGIREALSKVAESGMSINSYVLDATVRKLKADGYMPEK